MVRPARQLWTDQHGAAMVEMAIVLPVLLVLVLGYIDFGHAFYQWNAANKAVQVGARLASISSPIPNGLKATVNAIPSGTTNGSGDPAAPGDAVNAGAFNYLCSATNAGVASCTCSGSACVIDTMNQAAFSLIYAGDDAVCQGSGTTGRPGMCDFFPGVTRSEVRIRYEATGLGYWTRPDGPVPTITVSIERHPFEFFFLGGLLNFANITMPSMLSTVTGEDLSTNN